MKIISVTEGRKQLGELMNQVKYKRSVIALGKHGQADALLIPIPAEYEDVDITQVNADSKSFDWLRDEPDLYTLDDLQ